MVQEEGGGPQQETGVGAYSPLFKFFEGGVLWRRPTRSAFKAFMDGRIRCRTCDARHCPARTPAVVSSWAYPVRGWHMECASQFIESAALWELLLVLQLARAPTPLASTLFLCPKCLTHVIALAPQCSVPLGEGIASQNEPYWLEKMKHQGLSAYNKDPASYRTFRNVKDFGARGDGVTDDTQAILSVCIFPYLLVVTYSFH